MKWYFTKTILLNNVVGLIITDAFIKKLMPMVDSEAWWAGVLNIGIYLIHLFSLNMVFLLTLSSGTIFFNLFYKIRNNYFFSLLTYLLIPFIFFIWNTINDLTRVDFTVTSPLNGMVYGSALFLPYLIMMSICFIHFRYFKLKNTKV